MKESLPRLRCVCGVHICTHLQVLRGGSNATVEKEISVLIPRSLSVHDVLDFLSLHPAVLSALEASSVSRSSLRLWIKREGHVSELFLDPASLEDIAADYATRTLLTLDVRNPDGSWPLGEVSYPTSVDAPSAGESWIMGVKTGSVIDAKDEDPASTWFCAQVMRVIPPDDIPAPPSVDDKLHVHFFAWGSSFDIKVPRSEEWISPLFSKTGRWRHGVRPGDRIEVRNPQQKDGTVAVDYKWYLGWVIAVDHAHLPPKASVLVPNEAARYAFAGPGRKSLGPVRIVSLLSDDIDQVGTKMKTMQVLKEHQIKARAAEIPLPPAPACLPYTDLGNEMLQQLLKLDAQFPAPTVATAVAPLPAAPVGRPAVSSIQNRYTAIGNTNYNNYNKNDDDEGMEEADASGKDPKVVMLEKRRFYTEGTLTAVSRYQRPVGHSRVAGAPPGVCGLENLGNTVSACSRTRCLGGSASVTVWTCAVLHELDAPVPLQCRGADALLFRRRRGSLPEGSEHRERPRFQRPARPCVRALPACSSPLIHCASHARPPLQLRGLDVRHVERPVPGRVARAGEELRGAQGAAVHRLAAAGLARVHVLPARRPAGRHCACPEVTGGCATNRHALPSSLQCRVRGRKPAVPDVETAGRPDADVAADSWRNYLARNDSQVADCFGGQYKSHLVCNECGNTSVVFDPYTSVSVPSECSVHSAALCAGLTPSTAASLP